MIGLQSLRGSGLLVVLFLGGLSYAFGFEEGELLQAPTPAENIATPVPIPAHLSAPSVAVHCQCSRCRPATHRSRGFSGWFWGRAARDSTAEYNATYSGCNVNPEPPFGTAYNATMLAQVAKGEAALMVLHHFDFVPCQGELNFRGRLQLQKLARRAVHNPFPIIIEASRNDPELDAARHAAVVSELAFMNVPEQRVVIGRSPARGMDGLDAELIHHNLLRLTEGGVGPSPAGSAAAGAPAPR